MFEDLPGDKLNHQLIIELQKDSRQSNRRLAANLGVVEDTIKRRIEQLVASGNLRLTVLPELKKLNFPIRVVFTLDVKHEKLDKIAERLCKLPSLRFVGRCIGFSRIIIRGDFASRESMVDFTVEELGIIEGITSIDTRIEYEEIKKQYLSLDGTQNADKSTSQMESFSISNTDRHIILILQNNARAPLKEIAAEIDLSEATVHRRIKELVSAGIIRFTAIPNPSIFGCSSGCAVYIQTTPGKIRAVARQVIQYPNIAYVGITSGPYQISATVFAASVEALSAFVKQEIEKIDGVVRIAAITFIEAFKQRYTWLDE
jgi:Lrp/AsnC family transcriptional regulator for asnA, asnC and gidA